MSPNAAIEKADTMRANESYVGVSYPSYVGTDDTIFCTTGFKVACDGYRGPREEPNSQAATPHSIPSTQNSCALPLILRVDPLGSNTF